MVGFFYVVHSSLSTKRRGSHVVRERNKKATLEQIRTLFPFDVATLATQAGVTTDTLYYALLLRPIAQQDEQYRNIVASYFLLTT